jgi:hypothetical protein
MRRTFRPQPPLLIEGFSNPEIEQGFMDARLDVGFYGQEQLVNRMYM